MGTADFLAPEQARDAAAAGPAADIYSLGCTFYFCLTGEPPFPGGSFTEKVLRHINDPPTDPARRCDAPNGVLDLVRRMMRKDPSERPASMREVAEQLEKMLKLESDETQIRVAAAGTTLAGGSSPSKQDSPALDAAMAPTAPLPERQNRSKPIAPDVGAETRPRGWRRSVLVGLALLLVTAVIGGGYLLTGEGSNKVETNPPPPAVAPFNAKQARQHQVDWAGYLKQPVRFANSIGMQMVLIPAGEFQAGSTQEQLDRLKNDEGTPWVGRERQFLSETPSAASAVGAFYLGETEVTHGQFRKFVQATGYETSCELLPEHPGWGLVGDEWLADPQFNYERMGDYQPTDLHPVGNVSWYDAQAFCDWLTAEEDDRVYRLPTEVEWEFACRAGEDGLWPGGDDPALLGAYAWCYTNSGGLPQPCGKKRPNEFGLLDMLGNEWEWCADRPSDSWLAYRREVRILRGGNFLDVEALVRGASRDWEVPHSPRRGGFRVVCEVAGQSRWDDGQEQ